jgi:hypothetical protein
LPANKLKPQRGTMLPLAVEKFGAFSWDYCSFLLSFVREQVTPQRANHHIEIESHLNPELRKRI